MQSAPEFERVHKALWQNRRGVAPIRANIFEALAGLQLFYTPETLPEP